MEKNRFDRLFGVKKPIIGMIHLAGESVEAKVHRASTELDIYQDEGVDGAIIEDYHADASEFLEGLSQLCRVPRKIKLGINYLRSPCCAFELARYYGASFVQLDSVISSDDLCLEQRETYREIVVLGGVRFKYTGSSGNTLEQDISTGKQRCDAIVTTGSGTGRETPLEKLRGFKKIMEDYPLVVGAGVTFSNVYDQLKVADGAIIGSFFKIKENTHLPVDRNKVRELMDAVRDIRK